MRMSGKVYGGERESEEGEGDKQVRAWVCMLNTRMRIVCMMCALRVYM